MRADDIKALQKRLRHYGDNDRDAACFLIDQLGADLYRAEGRFASLERDLASSQGCVSEWVQFGAAVTEALGLRVMSPKAILAEIARLRLAAHSLPHQHEGDTALAVGNLIYALERWKASKPGAKEEWPVLIDACAGLVAAARPAALDRFGFEVVINKSIPAGVVRLYQDGKLVGEVQNIAAPKP